MPIMRPEHQKAMLNAQKVLNEIGIEGAKKPSPIQEEDPSSVRAIMERKGIGLEDLIEELAMKIKSSNEGLSSRAIDTALKMHGALKESAVGTQSPSFTINIIDTKSGTAESLPTADVNPIFIPRQLQAKLDADLSKTSN